MRKMWDCRTVIVEIREAFKDRIPEDVRYYTVRVFRIFMGWLLQNCFEMWILFFLVFLLFFSFELLMACGNKLVSPKLREGQELNGFMIHKVFKSKVVYIRPSSVLPVPVSYLKIMWSCTFYLVWSIRFSWFGNGFNPLHFLKLRILFF